MTHHRASQLCSWMLLLRVVSIFLGSCGLLLADELSHPSGPIVLTVTGKIQYTNTQDDNGEGKAEFDRAMLEALGMTELEVETLWTAGRPLFEGVKAADVMNVVGASGTTVKAIALNDYQFDIPVSDFEEYPVILALKMNGEYMSVRDKGPIWIIYPHEQFPELNINTSRQKWVWQLQQLHVE